MPNLNWLRKEKAIKESTLIPYRILTHEPDLSYGEVDAFNMLIQGA